MALGQILDYSRLLPEEAKRVVLTPTTPLRCRQTRRQNHRSTSTIMNSAGASGDLAGTRARVPQHII